MPRTLAWSVARALRINPGCQGVPVQGYAIPTADGGGTFPPDAAIFDLTAATLVTESETKVLELNHRSPPMTGDDLGTPEFCRPDAIILSVAIRLANGEVLEGEFSTNLLVSGQAGDHNAVVAYTTGSWAPGDQAELADLLCKAL